MNNSSKIVPLILVALIGGCSSEPTVGDKMQQFAKGFSSLGEQWNEGEKKIETGKNLIKDGEEMISTGNSNITKGRRMIEEGERMKKESEEKFKTQGGNL